MSVKVIKEEFFEKGHVAIKVKLDIVSSDDDSAMIEMCDKENIEIEVPSVKIYNKVEEG